MVSEAMAWRPQPTRGGSGRDGVGSDDGPGRLRAPFAQGAPAAHHLERGGDHDHRDYDHDHGPAHHSVDHRD
jgi:hypothetical protein